MKSKEELMSYSWARCARCERVVDIYADLAKYIKGLEFTKYITEDHIENAKLSFEIETLEEHLNKIRSQIFSMANELFIIEVELTLRETYVNKLSSD